MSTYRKLIENVFIFTLGSLGSKILSFVLVPLYTYYLSQEEYGTADLVITTVSMLLPVVSLTMHEAVIRFVMNKSLDRVTVIVNTLSISLIGYGIFLLFYPFLKIVRVLDGNLEFLYILVFVQMINQIFSQYTRGIGKTRIFALNGIITTFFNGILNVLFIVVFQWNLNGYFLSNIISFALSIIYLYFSVKPLENFTFKRINKEISKELLNYSVPLIPNNLMWWLINSSSRYFINWFIGVGANGLFAISTKLPSIINIVTQVFSQAWQISVFEEYEKNKTTDFYSIVLDVYLSLLLLVTSAIIIIIKPFSMFIFAEEYALSWQPTPFLLLATVFSSMSSFLGTAYTASRRTDGVFRTSIYGGGISLLLNILFVPTLGIVGAGISSMLSFFSMFIIRFFDTKKILSLRLSYQKIAALLFIIGVQTTVIFLKFNIKMEIMINLFLFTIALIINKNIFGILLNKFKLRKIFKNNKY